MGQGAVVPGIGAGLRAVLHEPANTFPLGQTHGFMAYRHGRRRLRRFRVVRVRHGQGQHRAFGKDRGAHILLFLDVGHQLLPGVINVLQAGLVFLVQVQADEDVGDEDETFKK